MKALTVVAAALSVAPALLSGQTPARDQQPATTFRSAIELVPVDVTVLDRDGRPVSDLGPKDFALAVDGKPRTVASVQFIAASREAAVPDPDPAHYSSNTAAIGGRLVMIVVDQGNVGTDRGKYAADAAARFISRLNPSDRIGLQTIPGAGPQIDFTENHALVQMLLQKIVGQAPPDHRAHQIGLSEALSLDRGDPRLAAEILDRECSAFLPREEAGTVGNCAAQVQLEARAMFAEARTRTRDSLLSLRHLMERLALTSTPKTVIFISEGVLIDREYGDVSWLGPLASRGQVTMYVLQLEPQQPDAARARQSPSREQDIQLAQDGLGRIAGLARGSVFRVNNNADLMLDRIRTELSGYYLLSFAPEPGDRDGKTHNIKVEVPGRKAIEVRSRREFAVDGARKRTTEDLLAETLKSPLLATDLGLKVATYTLREPASNKLKIIVAGEIDRSLDADAGLALAYALVDAQGDVVASQVEPEVKSAIGERKSQTYFGAVTANPGVYTLKLAVVDSAGKRGSVEHAFRAQLSSVGQIRMTDLLIADRKAGDADGLTPAVSADFSGDNLQAYIEVYSEAPELLKSATMVVEVAANDQSRALDGATAQFAPGNEPQRRVAEASVPIALLPPGDYVARAVLSGGGRKLAQVTRPFRIVRAAPSATPPGATVSRAPGTAKPIPFTSKVESFDRASVLEPPVVGFFIDRMNVGNRIGNAPPAVVEAIRAGKFDAALGSMAGATPVATAFVGGLALYAKADYEGAAVKFRESLKVDSEFFPAAFYLGACYAATGKDREAAGAWQTSLITQSDAPFIYTLLADAFMRTKNYDGAVDIMVEASQLWPDVDDVQMRLGIAQAAAGKPAEAIAPLDRYLSRHPEDHATLFIAMRSIYEARSAGKGVGTAAEDRERFKRYAAAYAAAGGPPKPEIERWKKFLER